MPLERADADLSARRMVGGPPTRGRRTRSGAEVSEAASRLVGQQSGTETAVERSRLGVLDLVLPLPFPHTPRPTRILIPSADAIPTPLLFLPEWQSQWVPQHDPIIGQAGGASIRNR